MAKRSRPTPAEGTTLRNLISEVTKEYGEGVIIKGNAVPTYTYLPTGIFTLDMALLGGIPESAFTLLYGNPSSGKSTLAVKISASAQQKYPDKEVLYVDMEGTYDPSWAEKHGVDGDRLAYARPQSGEQAVDIICAAAEAEDVSLIIVDSLAAMVPTKDLDSSASDPVVATRAKMLAQMMAKLKNKIIEERKKGHQVTVVMINQFRLKIGVMFGDPRTLPGGEAQHFYADVKIEMKNKERVGKDERDNEVVDYNEHSFVLAKAKTGNSLRNAEFRMIRNPDHVCGAGFIDDGSTVLAFGKKMGLVTGGGSSWSIDGIDQKFSKGDDMIEYLYANPEEFRILKQKLVSLQRRSMGVPALPRDEYL